MPFSIHVNKPTKRAIAHDPACPEVGQAHRPGAMDLAHQQRRDQEPGQDEEDVDADEPARQGIRPQVVDDDENHCDGAQRLEFRSDLGAT